MRLAALALGFRSSGQLAREAGGLGLGRVELGHRRPRVGLGRASRRSAARGSRAAASCHRAWVDARRRCGELVGDRRAGRLLLGLGSEPAGLRAELGEDVVDPGEVRLGLDELLLGLSPATLVTADAGDLLEQRPPLLGSEGERLVDHPLADEQERVVGEMRGVEQVDEIAKADALLVEEVLVLARAIQAPAELEDLEIDRQEGVGVVEDERDVGHALGGALLRARPR